jgi:hypothetical protein
MSAEKEADPSAQWETVTPEAAAELLATSPGNRGIRLGRVKRWAADATAGRFWQNGETIKIDEQGRLRDGHHRLLAVVESGVSVRMLVVRGVSEEAMRTVDGGSARTPGDRLRMDGERNVHALASALVWQARYENRADRLPSRGNVAFYGDDVFAALAAHPGMRDAVSLATGYTLLRMILTPSLLGFCIYHTRGSEMFWRALESGEQLTAGSPVLLLRERLLENRRSKTRLIDEEMLALVIKAHNAWKRGKSMVYLRWRKEGEFAEPFPSWLSVEKGKAP